MKLPFALFVLASIPGLLPATETRHQAQTLLPGTKSHIQISSGAPYADNTWLYTDDLILRDETADTSWFYYFTPDNTPPDANTVWNHLHTGTHLSAKNIPGIAHTPGYYYITNQLPAANPITIIRYRLTGLTASTDITLPNNHHTPVTFQPIIQPAGFHPPLTFQFSGTGNAHTVHNSQFHAFAPGKKIPLHPDATFTWDTHGRKTITLTAPGNQTQTLHIDIARLSFAEEETILLVNANDNNNDSLPDYKYPKLTGDTPDPEIKKIDLLLDCPHDNPAQPPHWKHPLHQDTPRVNQFLDSLKNSNTSILFSRTLNIHVHSTRGNNTDESDSDDDDDSSDGSSGDDNDSSEDGTDSDGSSGSEEENNQLLVNKDIYTANHMGIFQPTVQGNGIYRYELNPTLDTTDIRNFLDHLYLEGVRKSDKARDTHLTCSIQKKDAQDKWQSSASCTLPITIIHLRMNYSPSPEEIATLLNIPGWLPYHNNPLNIIPNPSVILLPDPNNPETDSHAQFKLEDKNQAFLANAPYNNLIEWSITPLPDVEIPFNDQNFPQDTMGENSGGNADFVGTRYGRQIQLTGTHKGFIRIGVRLKDTNTDYLHCHALVAPEIQIPYAFQFFFKEGQSQEQTYLPHVLPKIPNIIKTSNILLRQVGMKLIPAQPAQLLPQNRTAEKKSLLEQTQPGTITEAGQSKPCTIAKFAYPPVELRHGLADNSKDLLPNVKIVDSTGATFGYGNTLFQALPYQLLRNNDDNTYYFRFSPIVPPGLFDAKKPLYTTFDLETALPHHIENSPLLNGSPVIIHNNIPGWVLLGGGYSLTHDISSLPHIYNINVVSAIGTSRLLGFTVAVPPHNISTPVKNLPELICEHQVARTILPVPAPAYRLKKNIIDPQGNITVNDIPFDFPGAIIDYWQNFFPDPQSPNVTNTNDLFEAAATITHELGHACGLEHRSHPLPPPEKPDHVISSGYIPDVDVATWELSPEPDIEGCNHKNLMSPDVINCLDLDLSQAILMRNSIFPPPPNP